MSNMGSYDERIKDFDWALAEKELGYKAGDVINIGWYCSDRACEQGKGEKTALIWEGFGNREKSYTYNDVRVYSNTIGAFLRTMGIKDGDRVCIFLDRIPELYIGFVGILKIGAIAQPLFSAFGDESLLVRLENAGTRAVLTQKKHLGKIRKIKDKLPHLEHIIVVITTAKSRCWMGKRPFQWRKPSRWRCWTFSRQRRNPLPSSITHRGRPDSRRESSMSTTP